MDETIDEKLDSSPEETPAEAEVSQETEPATKVEKTVPYERFKEVNEKFKKANEELTKIKQQPPTVKTSLDVEDYIDISASLEGLDQREKEYLAQQHKLTGRPLTEIRNNEDFSLWQSAYRQKVEQQKTLKPSGGQPEVEAKKDAKTILRDGSLEEKEKLLTEMGFYKSPRPRADRVTIR